jgi:cobalt-zinc-cadmium efflux system outer membrane protein
VDVASIGIEAKRIEVFNKASQRYWYWVGAGKKYSIMEELLGIAKERIRGLEERVRQGDMPEFELKDNNRTILQRETQLIKAERSFQNASIELGVFVGEDTDLLLRG